MAGHSKFKNIQFRKGAQDKKRARIFARLGREITVAAKLGGTEPENNPRLRLAIQNARGQNMPKENIERAIKKGLDTKGSDFFEMRYEGFGPDGVAIIVEALTNNTNRTASDIRAAFSKYNGALGETGSASFVFSHVGLVQYEKTVADFETFFDVAVENGADDIQVEDEQYNIICPMDKLNVVAGNIQKTYGQAQSVNLVWIPHNTVEVQGDNVEKLIKLIETLEEHDDVQKVFANYDIDEKFLDDLNTG